MRFDSDYLKETLSMRRANMYPHSSEKVVWEICLSILEKDSPIPGIKKSLQDYRENFHEIFQEIVEEHTHIKGKYYRTRDKVPIVNPLYIAHYTRLIYYFSYSLYLKKADRLLLDQLFFSLRSRCNIDLFYEIELKKYFLPEHALATILGRAEYDDYFVVCQNATVGNKNNIYPRFGKNVILRPGSMVLGKCNIGNNVQIAAGAQVIDRDVPDNSIVFGREPDLVIKEAADVGTDEFFD